MKAITNRLELTIAALFWLTALVASALAVGTINARAQVAQQQLSADEYEALSAPWAKCLIEATDALVDQPERARTVVDAAFVSCDEYETAFRQAQSSKPEFVDKLKSETMVPVLLARVMTVRAARADLMKQAPSPPLDYKRM